MFGVVSMFVCLFLQLKLKDAPLKDVGSKVNGGGGAKPTENAYIMCIFAKKTYNDKKIITPPPLDAGTIYIYI